MNKNNNNKNKTKNAPYKRDDDDYIKCIIYHVSNLSVYCTWENGCFIANLIQSNDFAEQICVALSVPVVSAWNDFSQCWIDWLGIKQKIVFGHQRNGVSICCYPIEFDYSNRMHNRTLPPFGGGGNLHYHLGEATSGHATNNVYSSKVIPAYSIRPSLPTIAHSQRPRSARERKNPYNMLLLTTKFYYVFLWWIVNVAPLWVNFRFVVYMFLVFIIQTFVVGFGTSGGLFWCLSLCHAPCDNHDHFYMLNFCTSIVLFYFFLRITVEHTLLHIYIYGT